jgi:hypothetical protein
MFSVEGEQQLKISRQLFYSRKIACLPLGTTSFFAGKSVVARLSAKTETKIG